MRRRIKMTSVLIMEMKMDDILEAMKWMRKMEKMK